MDRPSSFLTTPMAVLLGSLVVSAAILMHGGIIKLNPKISGTQANVAAVPSPVAQPDARPAAQPTISLEQVKEAFSKSFIKFGDTNKKLIVVEVADPSCPFCHVAAGKNPELNKQIGTRFALVSDGGTYVAPVPEIKKLVDSGKAAFAWAYYPGHGSGEMGTKAMYCAFEKGKFWEVHDMVMNSEAYSLLNDTIKNDKNKAGELANFLKPAFDSASMKACLESGKYDSRIKEDMDLVQTLGVSGTPGFYLNDKQFGGAYNYTDMESTVKSALEL